MLIHLPGTRVPSSAWSDYNRQKVPSGWSHSSRRTSHNYGTSGLSAWLNVPRHGSPSQLARHTRGVWTRFRTRSGGVCDDLRRFVPGFLFLRIRTDVYRFCMRWYLGLFVRQIWQLTACCNQLYLLQLTDFNLKVRSTVYSLRSMVYSLQSTAYSLRLVLTSDRATNSSQNWLNIFGLTVDWSPF